MCALCSLVALVAIGLVCVSTSQAQTQASDWQAQVRKYAEARDWNSAIWLVEQQIARAPQDMDLRAWRARVLAWSGKLPEAEKEYLEILKASRIDPDNWIGLANVYVREGKLSEAQRAISTAEELDPKRSDIHAARARILRAEGQRKEAQSEFQHALHLDPGNTEARDGLATVHHGAQHELRFGQDNDLLSYSDGFHDEWLSVVSQWTSHWATSLAGDSYQRSGVQAGKFVGSITWRQSPWGALTTGPEMFLLPRALKTSPSWIKSAVSWPQQGRNSGFLKNECLTVVALRSMKESPQAQFPALLPADGGSDEPYPPGFS